MGKDTAIAWCHHTFNPWWGCTKISEGCRNCYAETFDKRLGGDHWGAWKPRREFGDKHWAEPLKWDRDAAAAGERRRVFCASMADVFDPAAPDGALDRLWALIRQTPHLDWLLLTKRPERIAERLPADWGQGYPNVWLGTTVEDQAAADKRIPILLAVPAAVRFLSCEPLIGPVDISHWLDRAHLEPDANRPIDWIVSDISWVIVGGESGPGARPMHLSWARNIVHDCQEADVPVFVKQFGSAPVDYCFVCDGEAAGCGNCKGFGTRPVRLQHRKGEDLDEWEAYLQVREFPAVREAALA